MERAQRTVPVFFSGQLFDYLKIESYKRIASQPKLEYLSLKKEEIKAITKGKVSREGFFGDLLYYVQFDLKFGFLLCVFVDGKCYRSYFFDNISAN